MLSKRMNICKLQYILKDGTILKPRLAHMGGNLHKMDFSKILFLTFSGAIFPALKISLIFFAKKVVHKKMSFHNRLCKKIFCNLFLKIWPLLNLER